MVEFIQTGGWFMYIILGVSIIALGIIIEKFAVLQFSYAPRESFFDHILRAVKRQDLEKAMFICRNTTHPLSQVIMEIIKRHRYPKEAIESAVDISFQKLTPKIQKRTGYLQMLGNVSTLVGLLGTINGLIISFSSLAAASASSKAALLASGISTAMNTTAFGLIVAIPCLVAHNVLTNKQNGILQKYEEISSQVIHAIAHEWTDRTNRSGKASSEG